MVTRAALNRQESDQVDETAAWVKTLTHRLIPLAASIMLVAGAIWSIQHYSGQNTNEVVVNDPETALQITREAFALLSGTVDQGEQAIKENIQHLDKTFIFKNL